MHTQRVTISLPDYLYQQLVKLIAPRNRSSFVAQIVEREIWKIKTKNDPIDEFINYMKKNKIPKIKKNDVLKAISKGRL